MAKSQATKNWLKYLKPNFWFFGIFFVVSILDQLIFAYMYDAEMSGFLVAYGYIILLIPFSIFNGIRSYKLLREVTLPNLFFCVVTIMVTWWMLAFVDAFDRAETAIEFFADGYSALKISGFYTALSFICSIVVKTMYLIRNRGN